MKITAGTAQSSTGITLSIAFALDGENAAARARFLNRSGDSGAKHGNVRELSARGAKRQRRFCKEFEMRPDGLQASASQVFCYGAANCSASAAAMQIAMAMMPPLSRSG